jgi:hypothetical protein
MRIPVRPPPARENRRFCDLGHRAERGTTLDWRHRHHGWSKRMSKKPPETPDDTTSSAATTESVKKRAARRPPRYNPSGPGHDWRKKAKDQFAIRQPVPPTDSD